jgi:hypothetical protein
MLPVVEAECDCARPKTVCCAKTADVEVKISPPSMNLFTNELRNDLSN